VRNGRLRDALRVFMLPVQPFREPGGRQAVRGSWGGGGDGAAPLPSKIVVPMCGSGVPQPQSSAASAKAVKVLFITLQ